ncbi:MADF domain-containing protein [Aphelenchoides besseyi]|nr:MADF domain-containing protein [Aphelenchoides besseyi]
MTTNCSGELDFLLAAIGEAAIAQQTESSDVKPGRESRTKIIAEGEFPRPYDLEVPAKSWWRYFCKQKDNTALCYTCGAVFNRGPKQSTTSLSHHLKQYHREQFIVIQQAKDEELRRNGKNRAGCEINDESRATVENTNESASSKKSVVNVALISAVKSRKAIYDQAHRLSNEDNQRALWVEVANEVGSGISAETAKKRFNQLRDRYRKELKFAIRDEFAYTPKWPYFWDMNFLDEHLRDTTIQNQANEETNNRADDSLIDKDEVTNTLLSSFLNVACNRSPALIDEDTSSTDSAAASLCDRGSTPANPSISIDGQSAESSALLAIHQFLAEKAKEKKLSESTAPPPAKRSRSRKSLPARVAFPSTNGATERFDWLDDENQLFGKIIAYRLRGIPATENKKIKILIDRLFDAHERGLPLPDY